jgi:hypothetical protein
MAFHAFHTLSFPWSVAQFQEVVTSFRADYGQSAPYCLFAPTGVAMPPRTAGFGNRDRFELNGKIGLHWAAG